MHGTWWILTSAISKAAVETAMVLASRIFGPFSVSQATREQSRFPVNLSSFLSRDYLKSGLAFILLKCSPGNVYFLGMLIHQIVTCFSNCKCDHKFQSHLWLSQMLRLTSSLFLYIFISLR
jgi:hypothetical protein